LLAGLLHCRRCGHKLLVNYTGCRHDVARYQCRRGWLDKGEPTCIGFSGQAVDQAVEILRVVQPAAIEAARLASVEQSRRVDEVVATLQRDLEAARYDARRAQKQYDQADPDNRLVADELERRWNQALLRVREVEAQIAQHHQRQEQATTPTAEEFAELAADLEAVWNDEQTDARLKKRVLRSLIRDIVVDVDVDAAAAEVVAVIHWKGGVHTELRLPRRRRGQNSTHTSPEAIEAVRVLSQICTDQTIASFLNRNGLLTGRGNRWTQERVTALRSHHGIACYRADQRDSQPWMNLTEAARQLHMSSRTLRVAAERGEIAAEHPLPDGPWVFNRDELASTAATTLVNRVALRKLGVAVPSVEQAEFSTT
jgi:Recombinase zinc beta ribbon domain